MILSKESIEKVLQEIVDKFLIPKFKDLGMNASGRWIDSLEVEFDGNGYIKGEDYTKYLVEGRPPNNMSELEMRNWAVYYGRTVIKDWADSKGITIDPIAIAYKIAREGTNYYPNGTDLLEVLQSKEVTDYFNERVTGLMIVNVQAQFENVFKELNK